MANYKSEKVREPYQELEEIKGSELNQIGQSSLKNVVIKNPSPDIGFDRSLELTSVSVIPDGKYLIYLFKKNNI